MGTNVTEKVSVNNEESVNVVMENAAFVTNMALMEDEPLIVLPVCNEVLVEDQNQLETPQEDGVENISVKDDEQVISETNLRPDPSDNFHLVGEVTSDSEGVKIDIEFVHDYEDSKPDVASADSEDSALGSLPCEPVAMPETEEEPQDRSDGSDSGLGCELTEEPIVQQTLSELQNKVASICTAENSNFDVLNHLPNESNKNLLKNTSTNNSAQQEKADSSKDDADSKCEKVKELKSNLKRKCETNYEQEPATKKKRRITFDNVTVYYFPRSQGFTCIPSQGGSTLGMANHHTHSQKFTLSEHSMEQRRLHRQILQQLRCEQSLQGSSISSSDYSDSEDEPSELSESELDLDSYYFLQPVPARQRRALLRAAGVRKIEGGEKNECRDIRSSREQCGCGCKGYCDPETCSCSQGGIKCQVDRLSFPCGCTRDGCGNTTGRIEFNPVRVRTHFIHTLMRLGLEKKSEKNVSKTDNAVEQTHWQDSSNRLGVAYPPNEQLKYDSHMLRSGNLNAPMVTETCVNNSSFNNVHYDASINTAPKINSNMQESLDLYSFRDECYTDGTKTITQQSLHGENYCSNMMKNKTSTSYSESNQMSYSNNSGTLPRFSCEYSNYSNHSEYGNQNQQFSASSFEDFSQQHHSNVFNHYNSMYMQQDSTSSSSNSDYHTNSQSYNGYRPPDMCYGQINDNKDSNQYTNLHTPAYQVNNKLESFSELIQGRYSYSSFENSENVNQPSQPEVREVSNAAAHPGTSNCQMPRSSNSNTEPPNNSESDENFGEIIKKTMVESVSA